MKFPPLAQRGCAGIGLLATIILSARQAQQKRSRHVRAFGWVLVAGPLPLAVALHAAGRLPSTADQVAFLSAVAAFAIGAALVLSADDEDDQRGDADDDSPPWWPEFEREFRRYARPPRPRPRPRTPRSQPSLIDGRNEAVPGSLP